MSRLDEKILNLRNLLHNLGSVAVAFSGGVDSTFLLKVAHDVLGDSIVALTAESLFVPSSEIETTKKFCRDEKIRHIIYPADVLAIDGVRENPIDRCYLCKRALFENFLRIAAEENLSAVIEGSNMDDVVDYRPGHRALEELKIKSPLREVGLYKSEIRLLSKSLGLSTHQKPAMACLATRFEYGEILTQEKLSLVEKAEDYLRTIGFGQLRVRFHNKIARLELLPKDFPTLMKNREEITEKLLSLGFDFVTLDLKGYRCGSMNIGA